MKNGRFEMIQHTEISEISFGVTEFTGVFSHFHRDLEIDLVLEGTVYIRTREEAFLAKAGSVLVFNAYQSHELISQSETTTMLSLHIQRSFCEKYFPALLQIRFLENVIHAQRIAEADSEEEGYYLIGVRKSLFHIGYNYYLEEFGFELLCYSDLNGLIFALLKSLPFQAYRSGLAEHFYDKDMRLQRILQYISEHYEEHITLADISRQENLTVSYLSHFIKDNLGLSFQEYVSTLRFEKAVRLLVTTDKNLTDISLESGFSESKYLNKMFDRYYHMKPMEYRRKIKNSWKSFGDQEWKQQNIFGTKQECLKILRAHYHYSCDDRIGRNNK